MKKFSSIPQVTGENVVTNAINTPPIPSVNFFQIVKDFILQNMGDIKSADVIATPGQAHAACVFTAMGELLWGLPKSTMLFIPARDADPSFPIVNLSAWRHGTARDARKQRTEGDASGKYFIFEGGHPVSKDEYQSIATEFNTTVDNLVFVKFGDGFITADEAEGDGKDKIVKAIIDAGNETGMTIGDWESGKVAFVPGGLGALGLLQATAIYGICGQWPTLIRLAAAERGAPFKLAEVIDLQSLRQEGKALEAMNAPVSVPLDLFNETVKALAGTELGEKLQALVAEVVEA